MKDAFRSQNVCGACPLMLRHLLLCASLPLRAWVAVHAEDSATGVASYYNAVPKPFDKFTAAHRTLSLGTMVAVTRIDNGTRVIVRINVVPAPQMVMTAAYDRAPAGICVTCLLPPIVD